MIKSEKLIRGTPRLYEYILARSNWSKRFFELNGDSNKFINDKIMIELSKILSDSKKHLKKSDFRIINKFDKEKIKELNSF